MTELLDGTTVPWWVVSGKREPDIAPKTSLPPATVFRDVPRLTITPEQARHLNNQMTRLRVGMKQIGESMAPALAAMAENLRRFR